MRTLDDSTIIAYIRDGTQVIPFCKIYPEPIGRQCPIGILDCNQYDHRIKRCKLTIPKGDVNDKYYLVR